MPPCFYIVPTRITGIQAGLRKGTQLYQKVYGKALMDGSPWGPFPPVLLNEGAGWLTGLLVGALVGLGVCGVVTVEPVPTVEPPVNGKHSWLPSKSKR